MTHDALSFHYIRKTRVSKMKSRSRHSMTFSHLKSLRSANGKLVLENGRWEPSSRDKSARRYEVSGSKTKNESIVRFQSVNMSSATSGQSNHVATQNNVMMNSVAVNTSQRVNDYP